MERLNEILNRYKIPFVLCLVGVVLIVGGLIVSKPSQPKANYPKESLVQAVQTSKIKIDISGAVNNPGVYPISSEARVEDAIITAGGFADNANADYISKSLNLSQKLSDGQKIYIPFQGENQGGVVGGASGDGTAGGKPSLNNASEQELDALPGVGSVTAQKIISGRPYSSVEDLLNKKAVSKSVFSKIKDLVTL